MHTPWCGRRNARRIDRVPQPAPSVRGPWPTRHDDARWLRPYSSSSVAGSAIPLSDAAGFLVGNANLARLDPLYDMMMMMMLSSIPAHSRSGEKTVLIDRRTRIAQCVSSKHLYVRCCVLYLSPPLFALALWPTAAALVGSVRNARTHRYVSFGAPPPTSWVCGPAGARQPVARRRRRRRRHGTALRAASDRSDLAMISAAPVRP